MRLAIEADDHAPPRFTIVIAYRKDEPPGPAGRWLFERVSAGDGTSQ